MELNPNACYLALCAHDARFDGRFFTGVTSTGIYCRPVCPVKTPKFENCRFYRTPAEAEADGYRPCLRCRPELAPGHTPLEAADRLAAQAAARLEDPEAPERSLTAVAEELGVSARHLRRVFQETYGVSPASYRATRRLLTAKTLLADTALPVTEVALASGFGSLRRFNALFRQQYGLSPGALRKEASPKGGREAPFTVALGYRPPLNWAALLAFLDQRAIPGVELVQNGAYLRTVSLRQGGTRYTGWLRAEPDPQRNRLLLSGPASLAPVLPQLMARVRRLFDLDCTPALLAPVLAEADRLKPGLFDAGIRLPGCFDGFEMAVRAVLGQQITVKGARTLAMRLASAFGTPLETPWPQLSLIFPEADALAALPRPIADQLGPLGITGARCRTLGALAEEMSTGRLSLTHFADPLQCRLQLLALPGIGPWTAEYITMRALSWPDAFPHTDYGVRKALGGLSDTELLALGEAFRPWRSYFTLMLWKSLAEPGSKED